MLSLHDAATLLRAGDPRRLAEALGFGPPLALDPRARRAFGLADPGGTDAPAPTSNSGGTVARASVAPGPGALRALLVEWGAGVPLREAIGTLGRAVAAAGEPRLWVVLARDRARGALAIALPAPGGADGMRVLLAATDAIKPTDAEAFARLAAERDPEPALRHLRWRGILGRDALTQRFYAEFERCIATLAASATGRVPVGERRTLAILHGSRLLFLAFLEAKGLLDGDRDFLRHGFERHLGSRADGRGVHRGFLEPLFFGTLNTPRARRAPAARALGAVPFLNGGLFARTTLERRHRTALLGDDALESLVVGLLGRFRLTAHEAHPEWTDAAVDPEMLGRAFESLIAPEARRAGGVHFTPQPLIARVTRAALDGLAGQRGASGGIGCGDRRGDGDPPQMVRVGAAPIVPRILDPACGSGAFLVFALEELAARAAAAGDPRAPAVLRRHLLAHAIFGVDRDPVAVWLCQLRLWLAVIVAEAVEDPGALAPLPNLDRQVREGDALAGRGFDDPLPEGGASLTPLRLRYARASGARKRTLARVLDRAERAVAIAGATTRLEGARRARRDLLRSLRARDLFGAPRTASAPERATLVALRRAEAEARRELARLREGRPLPFSFGVQFADVQRAGGFDLVLGNPPWVRPHAVPVAERRGWRDRFTVARDAAWRAGAAEAGAGAGFASQVDLAALFIERGVRLAAPGATIALVVPAKLWGSLAGGGVRRFLAAEAPPRAIETWAEDDAGFGAVVYPSVLLAERAPRSSPRAGLRAPSSSLPGAGAGEPVRVVRHGRVGADEWSVARAALPLDGTAGAPWLLVPPAVRRAFDALAEAGTPLARSPFGRPLLGVKTGCNPAFLLPAACRGEVEAALLRPVLRASALGDGPADEVILWTHDASGRPLRDLPPRARRWLASHRSALERRSDAARAARWWTLFRTEAADPARPRVVWGDIGRRTRAVVLRAGDPTVPLNSCYVVRAPNDDDAFALAALLDSALVAAWLAVIAEPARGGYRRFLGWTCARLPLPRDWPRVRPTLAALGRVRAAGTAGAAGDTVAADAAAHDAAVCAAYGLGAEDVAPLLAWMAR